MSIARELNPGEHMRQRYLLLTVTSLLFACSTQPPDGIDPITDFELSRYLGTWYEIARLDHRFERGLTQVTAEYQLRDGGGVQVINRGYSAQDNEWKTAEGKAFFVSAPDIGHLKVSFFGPFYGGYVIFELDQAYQHAYISGPSREYLWFLSRTPTVSAGQMQHFIETAKAAGFATDQLIQVDQSVRPD